MAGKKNRAENSMLTVGEACQLLHVHSNTLRRWSAKGLIRAYRVGPGAHRRFRREDVQALLREPTIYPIMAAGGARMDAAAVR